MDNRITEKRLHLSPHEARMEKVLKVLNCIFSSLADMGKPNTSTERTTPSARNQTEVDTIQMVTSPAASMEGLFNIVRLASCVSAVFFNGIILLSSLWMKRPIKPALYFPLSLALANMIMMSILALDFGWKMGTCFELVTTILLHAWTFVPILNIVGIEITIWSAAAFPDMHQYVMTGRTTGAMVFSTWVSSISLIVFYFGVCTNAGKEIILGECYEYRLREDGMWKVIAACILLLSLAIIGVLEFKTWQARNKLVQHQPGRQRDGDAFGRGMRYVRNTSLGILSTYVVGWTLFFLDYFLKFEMKMFAEAEEIIERVVALSVVIMTNISPIVYALRFEVIKNALRAMMQCGRPGSSP